jgi:hypothetical protein
VAAVPLQVVVEQQQVAAAAVQRPAAQPRKNLVA